MQRLLALSVLNGREFSPLSCGEALVCHIGKVKLAVTDLFVSLLRIFCNFIW